MTDTVTVRDRPLRVLHLVGSVVDDFHAELSHLYAADALDAVADPDRYDVEVAAVAPDGTWRFTATLTGDALADASPMALHEAVAWLQCTPPDVVVPQLFCPPGLTHLRALFELLGVPSVGNTATVMALTQDKTAARAIVAQAGVRVPDAQLVRRGQPVTLAPPVVVKPATADNSAGVRLVRDAADLPDALDGAWRHGEVALVETFVPLGREVRCGTVVRDGRLHALPLEEYALDAGEAVRTAADKLARDDGGRLRLVAKDPTRAWIVDPDDAIVPAASAAALACHRALGCRHHGLVDLRIDPDGQPWFLEAGPYCSFARGSVVVAMAAAAGIGVDELFADAIAQALAGHPAPT